MNDSGGHDRGQGHGSGRVHTNQRCSNKHGNANQKLDKKEMKFAPKVTGKVQVCTHETVKNYSPWGLQKDSEHGKDTTTNLRNGVNAGISLEIPVREEAPKLVMTEAQRED